MGRALAAACDGGARCTSQFPVACDFAAGIGTGSAQAPDWAAASVRSRPVRLRSILLAAPILQLPVRAHDHGVWRPGRTRSIVSAAAAAVVDLCDPDCDQQGGDLHA